MQVIPVKKVFGSEIKSIEGLDGTIIGMTKEVEFDVDPELANGTPVFVPGFNMVLFSSEEQMEETLTAWGWKLLQRSRHIPLHQGPEHPYQKTF